MLTTEADVVRTLAHGTMNLDQVYALCQQHTDISRDHGLDIIHGRTDTRCFPLGSTASPTALVHSV